MQRITRTLVAAALVCGLCFIPIHSLAEGEDADASVEEQTEALATDELPSDDAKPEEDVADTSATQDSGEDASPEAQVSQGDDSSRRSGPTLLEARSACVTDTFGNVIWEDNAYEELPMASITKVMTAMVALDSGIPLDTPVNFVKTEFQEDAQLANYAEGDTPTLEELLKVTLIYSGNDAALNVAYAVAGTQEAFADLMNAKAQEIGMERTHFVNPHGLEDDGHYSCAADLCVMGRYAMEHYPFIRTCVQTPSVTIWANGDEVTLWTTDHLMDNYAGLRGIKTGNTETGASFLGSARRNHNTLYSCVLCCDTIDGRFDDTERLLDWAFDGFDYKDLAHSDWVLGSAPWSDGFWLRCPVSARQSVTGSADPDSKVGFTKVMYKPGTLADSQTTYGTSVWKQGERLVGSVSYTTGYRTSEDLSWNPLMLPVMTDAEELV